MAKIKSIIQIVGTIKGTTFYFLNGVYLSRTANPPTKDQINNDPRFATVKANKNEFGGASIMSKAIRNGLGENENLFKDSRFSSRLTGVCRIIIQKGSGKKGEREAHLANMPEALKGFQLQKRQHFNRIFQAKPITTINADQKFISISIPQINIAGNSDNITHFRLIASISTISAHKWHKKSQKYKPTRPKANGLGAMCITDPLLCNSDYQNIDLIITNPVKQNFFQFLRLNPFLRAKSNPIAITVWLGITFGSIEDNTYNLQQKPMAMECIAVF